MPGRTVPKSLLRGSLICVPTYFGFWNADKESPPPYQTNIVAFTSSALLSTTVRLLKQSFWLLIWFGSVRFGLAWFGVVCGPFWLGNAVCVVLSFSFSLLNAEHGVTHDDESQAHSRYGPQPLVDSRNVRARLQQANAWTASARRSIQFLGFFCSLCNAILLALT